MVFVGAQNAPGDSFPIPPYTTVDTTPVVREKPFLYVDRHGAYQVFVPALRTNSSGTTWSGGAPAGQSLPLSRLLHRQAGRHRRRHQRRARQRQEPAVHPGRLPPQRDRSRSPAPTPSCSASAWPRSCRPAATDRDDGRRRRRRQARRAPLRRRHRPTPRLLMEVGPSGAAADHAANPTSLHDVFFRIGGAIAGKATTSLRRSTARRHRRPPVDLARRPRQRQSAGTPTRPTTASSSTATTSPCTACSSSTTRSTRPSGTATAAAPTSTRTRCPTTRRTRPRG